MRTVKWLMVLTSMTLLAISSGCASMINGEHQMISVKTDAETEIFINGRYAGKGYAKQKVARDARHEVRVEKNGCEAVSLTTQPNFNEVSLLGLFVDLGLVSIPTDFMTGAAWEVEPSDIRLVANCTASDTATTTTTTAE